MANLSLLLFWFVRTVLKIECKRIFDSCVSLFSYQGSCHSCDSHIRLSHLFELVKNFFYFFETFSELFPLVSVFRDSQSRLSHLVRLVKHFFEVFQLLFLATSVANGERGI